MADAIQTLSIVFTAFIIASLNAFIVVWIMTRGDRK
jgi:hypothetical protein